MKLYLEIIATERLATENWYFYFSLIRTEPPFFKTLAVRKFTATSASQIYAQFIHLNMILLVLFFLVLVLEFFFFFLTNSSFRHCFYKLTKHFCVKDSVHKNKT